jgi:acyl-CoA dehydrogenase
MSESLPLLTETAEKLFGGLATDAALDDIWPTLEEAGFPLLLTPEADGGFGGDWADAFAVFRLAGFHALPAPLPEVVIANWAAGRAGFATAPGYAVIAGGVHGRLDGGRFTGSLSAVPWGDQATYVLVDLDGRTVRLALVDAAEITIGHNPADEPRVVLRFEQAPAELGDGVADVFALGAFARAAQIAGALDAVLGLSIAYANERQQFGRPIGKFQAVQQSLAVLAEEAAAANCAGQAAASALDLGDAGLEMPAAKLRANMAAGRGGAIAHQVHGAIGFTREHPLNRFTRRLIAWRSEFGGDRLWSARLGGWATKIGAAGLWPEITRRAGGG